MITAHLRSWLPPLCLLLAIAAVLAFSGQFKCPDSSWDGNRAIARVGGECTYTLQFNTYLRDISLSLGLPDEGAAAGESGVGEYLRGRQRLASEFGLENAAFATLAQDLALYQAAVRGGQSPPDGEVMVVMGANRERIRGLSTFLELHELARESNLEGFRNLLESPRVRQLIPVQGEEHLLALFEEAARIDLSGAARGIEIHTALLESVGEDQYWTEVFFEQARWLVDIESFRLAVDEMESPPGSGLDWQDLREKIWGSTVIELTDAAPKAITLTDVRLYVNGLHALERDLLNQLNRQLSETRPAAPSPTRMP